MRKHCKGLSLFLAMMILSNIISMVVCATDNDYITNDVDQKTLNSIAITKQPKKVIYKPNQTLNTDGIEITGTYTDKSTEIIPVEDCNFSDFDSSTEGDKTIAVEYKEKTAKFNVTVKEDIPVKPDVYCQAHVENIGWMNEVSEGEIAGTVGRALNLEAIKINLKDFDDNNAISYRAHVENYGWQDWVKSGQQAGTTGKERAMEAIQIKLSDTLDKYFDIYYRVHVEGIGWLGWTKNGGTAGSTGLSLDIEAIQIRVVNKDSSEITESRAELSKLNISYKSHVENIGWMNEVSEGQTSGTTGQALNLEAIKINLKDFDDNNAISYRVHVENYGWQDWVKSGQQAGTTGKERAMEAIQIKLSDTLDKYFDIYYRVHVEGIGWLGWTKNGGTAGSTGLSLDMEAIQIRVVNKYSSAITESRAELSKLNISYQSHVENIGWMDYVTSGQISGTVGRGLRLEALTINLKDFSGNSGISYRTHVSNIGWMGWSSSGEGSGTTGRSLAVEAVQLKLSDSLAQYFDLYYRVHTENIGWLGWAKNSEIAGTTGGGLATQAIEVIILTKNAYFDTGGASYIDATSATPVQSETEMRLNSLINQYNGTKVTSAQLYMGSQCKGFANWVFRELFGVYIGAYPKNSNYLISNAQAECLGILHPGELNENSAKNLLKQGCPGDYIQVQRSTSRGCRPHSMILVGANDEGIQVFDCNSDDANSIKTYFISYSSFDVANRAMSLYRAW